MGLLHAGIHSALNGNPVSVASETDGFLSKMARKILPNARIYQDYKEMIENEHDIQGIIVTTPRRSMRPPKVQVSQTWWDSKSGSQQHSEEPRTRSRKMRLELLNSSRATHSCPT